MRDTNGFSPGILMPSEVFKEVEKIYPIVLECRVALFP